MYKKIVTANAFTNNPITIHRFSLILYVLSTDVEKFVIED